MITVNTLFIASAICKPGTSRIGVEKSFQGTFKSRKLWLLSAPLTRSTTSSPALAIPVLAPRDLTAVPCKGRRPGTRRSRPGDRCASCLNAVLGQRRGAAELAASQRLQDPALVSYNAKRAREMGCRGQLAAEHSPRLSSPIIFVGKFYLFNLLHIMHRLINYCFSAGRTRVYRAL